jgi:uncharacterized protein YqcC (DUF446 family)
MTERKQLCFCRKCKKQGYKKTPNISVVNKQDYRLLFKQKYTAFIDKHCRYLSPCYRWISLQDKNYHSIGRQGQTLVYRKYGGIIQIFLHENLKMTTTLIAAQKIKEISDELKRTGLWKKQPPAWVNEYAERSIATEEDFAGWLQFVYLPNAMQQQFSSGEKKFIVPQAMQSFGDDIKKGKLLQLLIELDSL